ncbi:MAG: hypothetical protein FWB96_09035 [Defluviitaleaceae bacterium]|nr:hypothetical protein [Defluviitaleaceae bacterium]MCL2263253.1 hypothetical protein [Defluviitaleaceae bacterium]
MKNSNKATIVSISTLLILILMTFIAPSIQNVLAEDIEGDGIVAIDKVQTIKELMGTEVVGLDSYVVTLADIDGNGWITMSDLFVAKNSMTDTVMPQVASDALNAQNSFSVRREVVNANEGIHRLVFSAEAPGDFTGYNVALSFDNEIITPVHRDTHAAFNPPLTVGVGSVDSFRGILSATIELAMWDAVNLPGRTAFLYGAAMFVPTSIDTMMDLFAFYFHTDDLDKIDTTTFSLVNRRLSAYETLFSAVNSGVELNVGGGILHWGNATQLDSIYNIVIHIVTEAALRRQLADLIAEAQILQRDTAISADGTDIPLDQFWATRNAHDDFLEAILEAIDILEYSEIQANS